MSEEADFTPAGRPVRSARRKTPQTEESTDRYELPEDDEAFEKLLGEDQRRDQQNGDSDEEVKKGPDLRIELIVARRPKQIEEVDPNVPEDRFEYLIKFVGKSYLHVEWFTYQDIVDLNPRYKSTVRKFNQKWEAEHVAGEEDIEEYFDPSYCEVDKILAQRDADHLITPPHVWEIDSEGFDTRANDESEETNDKENQKDSDPKTTVQIKRERLFLVKWKNLGYHQCTWEWESDVNDDIAVSRFLRSNRPPSDAEVDNSELLRCKYPKFYWGSTLNVFTADSSEAHPHPVRPPKEAESSESEGDDSESSSTNESDYSYSSDADSDYGEENGRQRGKSTPGSAKKAQQNHQQSSKKSDKQSKKHLLKAAVVATLKHRKLHEREVAEALDMVQNHALHNWLHYQKSISDAQEGRILRWLAAEAPVEWRQKFKEIWQCPANMKERYSIHRLHLRREIGLNYDGLPLVQLGNPGGAVSTYDHAYKSLPREEIKHLKVSNGWDPHDFNSRLRTTELSFQSLESPDGGNPQCLTKKMLLIPLSQISSLILSACAKKPGMKLNAWQQHVVRMSNQAPPHPDQYTSFWARSEYSARRAIRKAFGLPSSDRVRKGEIDDEGYFQGLQQARRERDQQKLRMRARILRIRYPEKSPEEIQDMIRHGRSVDYQRNVKLDSEESDGWSSVSADEEDLIADEKKRPQVNRPYVPYYKSRSSLRHRVHEEVVTDSDSDDKEDINAGCYPLKVRLRAGTVNSNGVQTYYRRTRPADVESADTDSYPLTLRLSQKRSRRRGGARLLRFVVATPPPESALVKEETTAPPTENEETEITDAQQSIEEDTSLSQKILLAFRNRMSFLDNTGKCLAELPVPHLRTRLTILRHLVYVGGRWILRFLDDSNFISSFPPTLDKYSKRRTALMETEAAALFLAYQFFSTKVAEVMRDRWSALDPTVVEAEANSETPDRNTDMMKWQKTIKYHLGPTPAREELSMDLCDYFKDTEEEEGDDRPLKLEAEPHFHFTSTSTESVVNQTYSKAAEESRSTVQYDPNAKRAPNTGVRLNYIDIEDAPVFVPPKSQAPIPTRMRRGSGFKPLRASPQYPGGKTLRSYQVEGLNWMIQSWHAGRNIILADEMGLGKTAQTVAFLHYLFTVGGIRGPFLIVAPLSTIEHWSREVEVWSGGGLNQCFYHVAAGVGRDVRAFVREWEWYYPGFKRNTHKFHVLITTYEVAKADADYLSPIPWEAMIIDEGHKIRGPHSVTKEILQNKLTANFKMLLTGTPLQNNTTELWSLLNFLEPDKWGTAAEFEAEFGDLRTTEQVSRLQRVIGPVILRRVKEQVEKSIPKKEETIIDVELTMLQKQYYRAIFEKNRMFLYRGCDKNNLPALSNIEIQLRKCCNHPYLISGVEDKDMIDGISDMQQAAEADVAKAESNESEHENGQNASSDATSRYETDNAAVHAMALSKSQVASEGPSVNGNEGAASHPNGRENEDEDGQISPTTGHRSLKSPLRHSKHHLAGISVHSRTKDPYENALARQKLNRLVACSGKMVLMDKLLPKLRAEGHKLLIFSQMVRMLDIMEDYCRGRGFPYERIDGGVRGNDRQAAIDRFQTDPNSFIFMLSTRAGGVGINLTAADTVIIFDSDWNPQNDIQATARAHRIGQTQEVKVYRLLTRNTYEAKMFERASKKLALDQAVLGGGEMEEQGGKRKSKSVKQAEELESLLRHGAYGALSGEGEDLSRQFVESSIDQLLKVNTRTVEVDNNTGYSVFKSSFSLDEAEKKGDDIDINAKDFWERVLPGYVSAAKLLDELNSGQATKSAETRKNFMDKVEKLVTGLKEMREKGELDETGSFSLGSLGESEVGTACSLLVHVSAMKSEFNDEDISRATQWLEMLEGTRVRSCRNQEFGGRLDGDVGNDFGVGMGRSKPGRKNKKADKRPRRRRGNETDSSVSDLEESDDDGEVGYEDDDDESAPKRAKKDDGKDGSSMYYRAEWGWSIPEPDETMESKRQAFWRELNKALDENGIPQRSRRCPLLGGKPLDLWTLWKEIILAGGNDKLTKTGGAWTQLFKKLPNYKKSETSATFRLKGMYKKWLQLVASKFPPQIDESKYEKNPDLPEEEDFTYVPKAKARLQDAAAYFKEFEAEAQEAIKQREAKSSKKGSTKKRQKKNKDGDDDDTGKTKRRKGTKKKGSEELGLEDGEEETPRGKRRAVQRLTYNEDENDSTTLDDDNSVFNVDLDQEGATATPGKKKGKTPQKRSKKSPGSGNKKKRRRLKEGEQNLDDVAPDEIDDSWHDSDQEEEQTDENGNVIRVQKPLACALCNNIKIFPGAAKRLDAAAHQTTASKGGRRGTDSDTPDTWDEDTGQFLLPFVASGSGTENKKLVHVHQWCAELSPEVFINDDGRYCNVVSAINRGKQLKCAGCGNVGATIGCQIDSCNKSYHLKCAMETGWEFGEEGTLIKWFGSDADPRAYYCKRHRAEIGLPCYEPKEAIHPSALKERKEDPPRMSKSELRSAQRYHTSDDETKTIKLRAIRWIDADEFDALSEKPKGNVGLLRWPEDFENTRTTPTGRDPGSLQNVYEAAIVHPVLEGTRVYR